MSSFTIIMTRDVTESTIITLFAEDEICAREEAYIQVKDENRVWANDDPLSYAHPYITDVEENS